MAKKKTEKKAKFPETLFMSVKDSWNGKPLHTFSDDLKGVGVKPGDVVDVAVYELKAIRKVTSKVELV